MTERHQISRTAIALIKRFEGYRASAAQLDDGRWTIGHGHTRSARQGASVNEADAEALLRYDLIGVIHAINEWVYAPLNQNQVDALASFVFNIGVDNFKRSATLRWLNQGRMLEAAMAMELWRRADLQGERMVVDALVRRRAFEKTLFLRPIEGWPVSPSPLLPPRLDYDSASVMPSQPPSVVTARLEGDRIFAEVEPAPPPPTRPEPIVAPTATEAAADAVSARLGGLFADKPAEPSSAPVEPSPAPIEAPFPKRPVAPAPEPEKPAPAAKAPALTLVQRVGRKVKTPRTPVSEFVWLITLAIIGAGLFAGAVLWGFKAPRIGAWLGWIMGGLGIAGFATAAYLLLARLPDNTHTGA